MTISQLKAELEKGPQEAAVYTQQIHQLQSNLNQLQQQCQVIHLENTLYKKAFVLFHSTVLAGVPTRQACFAAGLCSLLVIFAALTLTQWLM